MSDGNQEKLSRQDQIWLVEYQKAQDSAEHHDRLLWVAVGLLVTGMATLFVIPPGGGQTHSLWSRFYPPVLGILLSCLLIFFVYSFASFKCQKYDRCKFIEGKLGMEQHVTLKSPQPGQRHVVYFLAGLFLAAWLLRLCWELCR